MFVPRPGENVNKIGKTWNSKTKTTTTKPLTIFDKI